MTERLVCAYEGCTNPVSPGEAYLAKNGLMYCSAHCALRDQFPGPVLPGPANAPAEN